MLINQNKMKIGFFIITDEYQNILNDFSLDVADRIIEKLRSKNIEVYASKKVLKRQREATAEAMGLAGKDLDAIILYLPTWIECPNAIAIVRELEGTPIIIWGFNLWENEKGEKNTTGSVVAEIVLKGTLERMNYKFLFVAGFPEEDEKFNGAIDYIYAARAKKLLKRVRFGQLGYAGLGMYPGTFDHVFMRRYIGPEIVPIPECIMDDNIKEVSNRDLKELMDKLNSCFDIKAVKNNDKLELTARIYLALKKIITDYELDGINTRCHYDFSKRLKCTCCVPISLLSDEKIVTGCEGDIITSISMFIFYLLSDQVVTYGDILDFDYTENITMFSACGYAPFKLIKNKIPVLHELLYENYGFAGILSSNVYKQGRITFGRMFEKKGDYGFVYGTGEGVHTELRGKIFPALNVNLDGKVENLIKNAPTQHFALVYGDLKERLNYFLELMGIEKIIID
jgi:L-fucose isomerase-like protein